MTHIDSKKLLWFVFIALMALLILTVSLSFVPMGGYEAIPAYLIAILKALLVVLFFMEVRHMTRLTWVFVGAGFLWLGIMMVLTMSDYMTRSWLHSGQTLHNSAGSSFEQTTPHAASANQTQPPVLPWAHRTVHE